MFFRRVLTMTLVDHDSISLVSRLNQDGCLLGDVGMQPLVELLAAHVLRPMAFAGFNRWVRAPDLTDSYGFTVLYEQGGDIDLAQHADASTMTLNVCLGDVGFEGGALAFRGVRFADDNADDMPIVVIPQRVGKAVLHRGQHLHRVLPLESGLRENLVVWATGKDGYVRVALYDDEVDDPKNTRFRVEL